jgi:hypothetical protein
MKIHAIRTGSVRIKHAQVERQGRLIVALIGGFFPDLDRISISLRDVVSAFLGSNVTMPKEGLICHAGFSNARIEDIDVAQKFFPVVSVQNRYNLVDRASEDVLEWCAKTASASFHVPARGRRAGEAWFGP